MKKIMYRFQDVGGQIQISAIIDEERAGEGSRIFRCHENYSQGTRGSRDSAREILVKRLKERYGLTDGDIEERGPGN